VDSSRLRSALVVSKRLRKARSKAARKGARTRAVNRATVRRWHEVERPAMRRMTSLLNHMLSRLPEVHLRWNPLTDTGHKLKNGASYGTLVRFINGGRILRVLPEGYKQPKDYHPAFWEPLYGKRGR